MRSRCAFDRPANKPTSDRAGFLRQERRPGLFHDTPRIGRSRLARSGSQSRLVAGSRRIPRASWTIRVRLGTVLSTPKLSRPLVNLNCAPSRRPVDALVLRSQHGRDFVCSPNESLPRPHDTCDNALFSPLCAHHRHRQSRTAVRNFRLLTWAAPPPTQARLDEPPTPALRTAARLAPRAATVPDRATSH